MLKLDKIKMMVKLKKILRSISLVFICTICVFLCACGGGWNLDEIDEDDLDDYQFGVIMDNIKILRRSYGENKATVTALNEVFYDNYVFTIAKYLTSVYGVLNITNNYQNPVDIFTELKSSTIAEQTNEIKELLDNIQQDYTNNEDYFKYYYDSMRYQIVEETPYYIPKWKKTDEELYSNADTMPEGYEQNTKAFATKPAGIASESDFVNNSTLSYYEVTIDTSKGWNWSANYILGDQSILVQTANIFPYAYEVNYNSNASATLTNDRLDLKINAEDYSYNTGSHYGFYGYYANAVDGYGEVGEYGMYFDGNVYASALYNETTPTDFQKALSYVVYSIVNNETPNNITVQKTVNGNIFTVEGFGEKGGKSSIDNALEHAKQVYVDNASYVGLTNSDQKTLINYILNNVIGQNAVEESKTTRALSRYNLHYEEFVTAIVKYCTALTSTGATYYTQEEIDAGLANGLWTEENKPTVGQIKNQTYIGGQYLSSDIVDYEYNSSYVNSDAEGFEEFMHIAQVEDGHLEGYEYQSMLLMPAENSRIDEIWVDFGYYGDGGTDDSITIRTYVRNYVGNGQFVIYTEDIEVKEGVVDVGEDGTTLMFDFTKTKEGYIKADKIDFDDAINSQYYQKRVEGIRPLLGFDREIIIGNMTEARNYYSLIEGEYRDYGVFNHNMLIGTDYYNSSYVEVAFEVISTTCDNYKFFCGFSVVGDYQEIDYSKWQ